MRCVYLSALATSALALQSTFALADPLQLHPAQYADQLTASPPHVQVAAAGRGNLGGGFIEFLFGGRDDSSFFASPNRRGYQSDQDFGYAPAPTEEQSATREEPGLGVEPAYPNVEPKYLKQVVDYDGHEPAGTIIIDTPRKFLFLVQPGGKAVRYGIGVGRPGFTWSGVKQVSGKREWPDWRPPPEMLKRRPDLPSFMAGGPNNPLGARALYLGSSLYRIHGSNEPWTIGTQVSSGCIRMRNEDVMDLYERVRVGTKVVVI